jgi:cycloeucalenol cycloisomerase
MDSISMDSIRDSITSAVTAATQTLGALPIELDSIGDSIRDSITSALGVVTQTLGTLPIELTMALILVGICLLLALLSCTLTLAPKYLEEQTWLPSKNNAAKREFEIFALHYTAIWIGVFALVILWQLYESFTAESYLMLCVPLALPFLLQPLLFPLQAEKCLPLFLRYSFKANVWLAIFSFVGNYWYTHYFYSVLKASYTFPAHRLNDVPIALYFATHFYFVTYHTLSNLLLRRIETRYAPGLSRSFFFWGSVLAFSYFTAFMETLTISSFPYYSFQDRFLAYTLGSAFYGLYFIVSFPVFYRIDEKMGGGERAGEQSGPHTVFQTCMESLGTCMLVLCLLDFCRLHCGIDLHIGGLAYYVYPLQQ